MIKRIECEVFFNFRATNRGKFPRPLFRQNLEAIQVHDLSHATMVRVSLDGLLAHAFVLV
jgi:hypothetical protein